MCVYSVVPLGLGGVQSPTAGKEKGWKEPGADSKELASALREFEDCERTGDVDSIGSVESIPEIERK